MILSWVLSFIHILLDTLHCVLVCAGSVEKAGTRKRLKLFPVGRAQCLRFGGFVLLDVFIISLGLILSVWLRFGSGLGPLFPCPDVIEKSMNVLKPVSKRSILADFGLGGTGVLILSRAGPLLRNRSICSRSPEGGKIGFNNRRQFAVEGTHSTSPSMVPLSVNCFSASSGAAAESSAGPS